MTSEQWNLEHIYHMKIDIIMLKTCLNTFKRV